MTLKVAIGRLLSWGHRTMTKATMNHLLPLGNLDVVVLILRLLWEVDKSEAAVNGPMISVRVLLLVLCMLRVPLSRCIMLLC